MSYKLLFEVPFLHGANNRWVYIFIYAERRDCICNSEEKEGKCGLSLLNKRFVRNRGSASFAAQPKYVL